MTDSINTPEKAKEKVLVIGGGISGITAALELARLNMAVTLIEKEQSLGGLAASFSCKASEVCNKCFACVVDKRIKEIESRDDITILRQTELLNCAASTGGSYQVTLNEGGEKRQLQVDALLVAAGIEPYEASQKGEYGYGRFKNVVTARDLEERLRTTGALCRPSDNRLPAKVAFFQCVGSRDQSIGNLYCSQVCCAYALRLIALLRYTHPAIDIAFYYMDIQPAGVNFADFLSKSRKDEHIRFIRSLPSKVNLVPKTASLQVRFADASQGEVSEEEFDLVVLSVGMTLHKGAKSLAEILMISTDEDGFLRPGKAGKGLFATGACSGPKDIDRSITQAKATAHQVYEYLRNS